MIIYIEIEVEMMKKVFSLLLCALILFSVSACGDNSDKAEDSQTLAAESFVGEGEKTVLRSLISANAFFVDDVFITNHLPVNLKAVKETADGKFAPVVSDKIGSLADLKNMLEATYTADTAQKLLDENKYVEIDGKLYFNMKYDITTESKYDWSSFELDAENKGSGKYALTVTVNGADGKKAEIEMTAVTADGNIRLENIYY